MQVPVESPLIHVIYASAASRHYSEAELLVLLNTARERNAQAGVTGILLYVDETFFQVLEGPSDAVMPIYERIATDKRHAKVLKLIVEPIEARSFAEWSMGLAQPTRAELAAIPGLSDFFASKATLLAIPAGRTRKLLAAFAEGSWRARVLR